MSARQKATAPVPGQMSNPSSPEPPTSAESSLAQALRDQEEGLLNCVHCGFCLPACPTYRRLGDEADSPRGRLHLMRAVVEGRLDPGAEAFQTHIGRCLGCRACEPVCPSGVAYGHLLERARRVGSEATPLSPLTRIILRTFGTGWIARPLLAVARVLRGVGLPALAARWSRNRPHARGPKLALAMLAASAPPRSLPETPPEDSAPATPSGDPPPSPPPASSRSTVGILTGCVQAGLFARVNHATRRVLEANGYDVVAVAGQGCCGALHAHAGDLDRARELARRNVAAFERAGVDYLAMNASGCGAAIREYGALFSAEDPDAARAAAIAERVRDLSELLAERGPRRGEAIHLDVTADAPCHLVHAQGITDAPAKVLRSIPGLRLLPLAGASECCGGAGIYGLTQPELGGMIGGDKVRSIVESGAAVAVTGNPGCIMQIGAGLRLAGSAVAVLHPVELLDESYRRAGFYTSTPGPHPIVSANGSGRSARQPSR